MHIVLMLITMMLSLCFAGCKGRGEQSEKQALSSNILAKTAPAEEKEQARSEKQNTSETANKKAPAGTHADYEDVRAKQMRVQKNLDIDGMSIQAMRQYVMSLIHTGSFDDINGFLVTDGFQEQHQHAGLVLALYSNLIEKAADTSLWYMAKMNMGSVYANLYECAALRNPSDAWNYLISLYHSVPVTSHMDFQQISAKDMTLFNLMRTWESQQRPIGEMFTMLAEVKQCYSDNRSSVPPGWLDQRRLEPIFYEMLARYATMHANEKCSTDVRAQINEFLNSTKEAKYEALKNLIR